jgi:hypothetical protein
MPVRCTGVMTFFPTPMTDLIKNNGKLINDYSLRILCVVVSLFRMFAFNLNSYRLYRPCRRHALSVSGSFQGKNNDDHRPTKRGEVATCEATWWTTHTTAVISATMGRAAATRRQGRLLRCRTGCRRWTNRNVEGNGCGRPPSPTPTAKV